MTEYPPQRDQNTAYETTAEAVSRLGTADNAKNEPRQPQQSPQQLIKQSQQRKQEQAKKEVTTGGSSSNDRRSADQAPAALILGPDKRAVLVPVLEVRLKLKAIEDARLEAERKAAADAAAALAEVAAARGPPQPHYYSPRNITPRERPGSSDKKSRTKNADRWEGVGGAGRGGRGGLQGRREIRRDTESNGNKRVGRSRKKSSGNSRRGCRSRSTSRSPTSSKFRTRGKGSRGLDGLRFGGSLSPSKRGETLANHEYGYTTSSGRKPVPSAKTVPTAASSLSKSKTSAFTRNVWERLGRRIRTPPGGGETEVLGLASDCVPKLQGERGNPGGAFSRAAGTTHSPPSAREKLRRWT